jgi:hypothetical protein
LQEGIEQGTEQKAIETAIESLKNNLSVELISKITGLPLEKIQELEKELATK